MKKKRNDSSSDFYLSEIIACIIAGITIAVWALVAWCIQHPE